MQKADTNPALPFDPNGEIFRWGPVPGKFFYLSVFCEVHYKHFRAKFAKNWSETLYLFREGRMFWINDLKAIEKAGEEVFLAYMLPPKIRQEIYKEWQADAKKLASLEEEIDKADLAGISNQDLLNIWNDFNSLYTAFLVTGSVPELANYASVPYLQGKLSTYIKDERIQADALEVLTAPNRLSFYQEEEIELSKTHDVAKHQQEYFWLKNSYAGTEILPVEFFAARKQAIPQGFENDALSKLKAIQQKKHELGTKHKIPQEVFAIADAISEGVGWQDERKKIILVTLQCESLLLREVARRFEYLFEDLELLGHVEIARIISGGDMHQEIARRKNGFGLQFFHSCRELSSEEVFYFWNVYQPKTDTQHIQEIKGIVVSKGNGKTINGPVRVLLDPSQMDDFKEGDILLAPMTSPEYIFAMKKAAAVVTDEGGLTSHAAIVSRELGIPCIVGTKIATKVLKDGDMVEVDADKGIVRILK